MEWCKDCSQSSTFEVFLLYLYLILKEKAVCVDFDSVIDRYSEKWQDGSIYDPPMKGTREH